MTPRLLTRDEFNSLASDPVESITGKEEIFCPNGVIDIEPYVRAVPSQDLNGYSIHDGFLVEVVYRAMAGPFDFVHVMTQRKNVYLVVVIDIAKDGIVGHHLLDLNEGYGIGAANDA